MLYVYFVYYKFKRNIFRVLKKKKISILNFKIYYLDKSSGKGSSIFIKIYFLAKFIYILEIKSILNLFLNNIKKILIEYL